MMKTANFSLSHYEQTQKSFREKLGERNQSAISAFFHVNSDLIYANYYIRDIPLLQNSPTDHFELYFIYSLQNFVAGKPTFPCCVSRCVL